MLVVAVVALAAPPATAQTVNRDDITYVLPYWFPFSGASDAAVAAEIADMRARLGPEGPYAKLGFAVYVHVRMQNWQVDITDPAAVRAALASTIAQIDNQLNKARRLNVPISLSVLTAIRDTYDPVQTASEDEDVRSVMWYADNELAAGWWTHSRYARKARRIQEAYIRELGRVIANRMSLYPDILVAASGDGEVELPYARIDQATGQKTNFGDYSPFTVAEFRDWLRHDGMYAPGATYAGEGYADGARYAGDASPAEDTYGDGHTLNGDFGTAFTTWDLRHSNWSLADPWQNDDPRAIPLASYVAADVDRLLAGGFDAPRSFNRGQPWWDVWDVFKQTLLQHHNRDFAKWATTSADPETGATIPATRWYSYQIPGDYLFGGTPEYPTERWYSSMSSWWTADIAPYGGVGITGFNVDFIDLTPPWQAVTIPNLAPHIAARDRRWGIIEWNPGVTHPLRGESTNQDLFDREMDAIAQYRPTLLQPWVWAEKEYWQKPGEPCCGLKDTLFETALRGLVARLKDGLPPDPRLEIEIPAAGARLVQPFTLSGWALDLGKIRGPGRGPGVDEVQVVAQLVAAPGDPPLAPDAATYGLPREDKASEFGSQFRNSGFAFGVNGLAPGRYTFTVRARSTVTNRFSIEKSVTLDVYNQLTTSPAVLTFAATKAGPGDVPVSSTPAQTVTVSYAGAGSPSWTATADQPWVALTNASGTGAGQLTVGIANPGNVIGASTHLTATVTVTAPNVGAMDTVPVTLTVDQSGGATTEPPFGLVDTPAPRATDVVGTIPLTGWALDDVGVSGVRIYRTCLPFEPETNCVFEPAAGQLVVFVGDATMVTGARPDIEALYPGYPQADRAAWGYLLLTNLLPDVPNQQMFGGEGELTLYAIATDAEGKQTLLGRMLVTPTRNDSTPTVIVMNNLGIAVPFGAIDTPWQGQTVRGVFANFGWVLTPDLDTAADAGDILVPVDGSTMQVLVDGVRLGFVTYNQCRGDAVLGMVGAGQWCDDDVANIFGNPAPRATFTPRSSNPTLFRNLDAGRGAIGAFLLDTSRLTNGVHTIMWVVRDNRNRADGIGSRYFTVLNAGTDARAGTGDPGPGPSSVSLSRRDTPDPRSPVPGPRRPADVFARTGFSLDAPFTELIPDEDGVRHVQVDDMGRLELRFAGSSFDSLRSLRTGKDPASRAVAVTSGHSVVHGERRPLPVGSHLDTETGTFTWAPGVGFLGTYRLAFGVRDEASFPRTREPSPSLVIDVTIRPVAPPAPGEAAIRMALDLPQPGATVRGAFVVAGWALDPHAAIGAGIGAVHVWAQRMDVAGVAPVFLGAAALDGARPDVAGIYGAQFAGGGYNLAVGTAGSSFDSRRSLRTGKDPASSNPASMTLPPGTYDITAYVWNTRTARWEDARTVTVFVR